MRIDESDGMGAVLPDDIVKQHEWTEEVVKSSRRKCGEWQGTIAVIARDASRGNA